MSWKNKLRPASFRGASFGVESHQTEQGRRTQVHEYPGRDDPYVEDLGLQDVRRAVVQAVPDAQNELPRLREITPKASLPVLVLAYSVHGDTARSGEMLRHNVAAHPGFMPVAPLRVLSD